MMTQGNVSYNPALEPNRQYLDSDYVMVDFGMLVSTFDEEETALVRELAGSVERRVMTDSEISKARHVNSLVESYGYQDLVQIQSDGSAVMTKLPTALKWHLRNG